MNSKARKTGSDLPPSREIEEDLTILHSRSVADVTRIQSDLLGTDARVADLFLRFVLETAEARDEPSRLLSKISEFTFQAFPVATHLALVTRNPSDGEMWPLIAESRDGEEPNVVLSGTLMNRVMNEGISLIFARSESTNSGIKTAICAPLSSPESTFGVMQLDIRGKKKGTFATKDVDRIAVFAHHVALVLDNHRLYLEQRQAFESTINALVHSLSLKDSDTASHSVRVRDVSVHLGKALELTETQLETLKVAALLHDLGKHGIRDEVLLKPGKLSQPEREEMSQHSELTQTILDKITFPGRLKDVPMLAAYHHEKIDGSGPYKLAGDAIPIQSRIIAVADVFDALVSARVYKKPLPPEQALTILGQGRNLEFDPLVIDTLKSLLSNIMAAVYGQDNEEADLAA